MKNKKNTRHIPNNIRLSPQEPPKPNEKQDDVIEKGKALNLMSLEEPDDSEINEEGDCIGHYDENAPECEDCEIQVSCKDMTDNLKSMMEELTKDNGDGKKER
jgi:hypothetical protein